MTDNSVPTSTATTRLFSYTEGRSAAKAADSLGVTYLAIVLGVVLHFLWEIMMAAVKTGSDPQFGGWWQIIARGVIAIIISAVSFVGIWKQLEDVDTKVRFFMALTLGFALDALASPVIPAADVSAA